MSKLTAETVRLLLDYNQETGVFLWRERPLKFFKSASHCQRWNNRYAGKVAGHIDYQGYNAILIFYKRQSAARLAWLYVTGEWPENQIDHINHDRADDRFVNLRDITQSENAKNSTLYKSSTSGVCGVNWYKPSSRWRAQIKSNGVKIHLGYFKDKDDAIKARKAGEIKYGFHSNHGEP